MKERGNRTLTSAALRLYITGMAVAAMTVLSLSFFWPGADGTVEVWLLTGVFAFLLAAGGIFPLAVSSKVKLEVTTPVLLAAVVLLPLPLAMLVGGLGRGVAALWRRLPWNNVLFNAAEATLGMGLAGVTYAAIAPHSLLDGVNSLTILGTAMAAPVLYLENTLAVALAVGLQLRRNPLREWWLGRQKDLMAEGALYILGFLASVQVSEQPWTLVLLPLPVVIIYFAFKDRLEKAVLNEKLQEQMKELKLTQAQLIQAAKMASVGTLAAGVAHEINNPIFVIGGNAELLLDDAGDHLKTDKARKLVGSIAEMSERVAKIVTSLLSYSRNKDEVERLNVNEAIENSLQLVGKGIQGSNITLVKDMSSDLPAIPGKPSQVEQVVMNILSNARDAMPGGGRLTISTGVVNGAVKASFEDTGMGIPPEVLPRLFEPFFTTKEPGKGTGLGLFISQRIMQEHQGRIEVMSTPGEGSTFTLWFPVPKE